VETFRLDHYLKIGKVAGGRTGLSWIMGLVMTAKIKLQKSDGEITLALPADLVTSLDWKQGDICECVIESGGLRITRIESAHDRAMKIADEVMEEYREVFEALAKT
jgi:hypothetical protein